MCHFIWSWGSPSLSTKNRWYIDMNFLSLGQSPLTFCAKFLCASLENNEVKFNQLYDRVVPSGGKSCFILSNERSFQNISVCGCVLDLHMRILPARIFCLNVHEFSPARLCCLNVLELHCLLHDHLSQQTRHIPGGVWYPAFEEMCNSYSLALVRSWISGIVSTEKILNRKCCVIVAMRVFNLLVIDYLIWFLQWNQWSFTVV